MNAWCFVVGHKWVNQVWLQRKVCIRCLRTVAFG